jgi:hypothetical protein
MCYDSELSRTHFLFLNNAMILSQTRNQHMKIRQPVSGVS